LRRLSFVIADSDIDYLNKFEKFLMVNYTQWFDIFSFSSPGKLTDFLSSSDKKEILLINSKIYKKELHLKNIETVMLLSDGSAEPTADGLETLFKYQHAEKLVTDILRLYASRSLKAHMVSGQSSTQVVCVFSPSGGAGKTSIAAGCSILCSRKGLRTFYLNMEDNPSTSLFFHNESEQSVSNVIYHLKGKGNNLGLKLEGAKSCDPKSGVCFFSPPDSMLELEELTGADATLLVNELKASSIYDVVFIDMSCGLNKRNTALLGCADSILMVLVPDDISNKKMKELGAAFELSKHKYGSQMTDQMITILNRYDERINSIGTSVHTDNRLTVEIGECKVQRGISHAEDLVENLAFLSSLNRLLEVVLSKGATTAPAAGGGESIA